MRIKKDSNALLQKELKGCFCLFHREIPQVPFLPIKELRKLIVQRKQKTIVN